MTKKSDTDNNIIGFKNQAAEQVCRVSYIIDNDQPVISTHIGDQPLFYMDCEIEEEVFEDFEDLTFKDLETGLAALENKIKLIEDKEQEPDAESTDAGQKAMDGFLANAKSLFEGGRSDKVEKTPCNELVDLLRKSRLGATYISLAETKAVNVSYDRQTKTVFYDRNSGDIFVNPDLAQAEQILLLARELRRFWQHQNGALLHPLLFCPDESIVVNRTQQADLAANMVRVAWELQIADEPAAWKRLMNSSMQDLGQAFARESFLDFRALNNGIAAGAVFETWFLSSRCDKADKELIQLMLSDYQGIVFDNQKTSKTVTAEFLAALGKMPFGKNYLAPYQQTILHDPLFTEVRDRSNANFLWFVKFEQSFHSAARNLQAHETVHSDAESGAHNNQKDDDGRMGSHEQVGKIYYLSEINSEQKSENRRCYSESHKTDRHTRPEE